MQIKYSNSFEDLLAFNEYHFDHSKALKKQLMKGRISSFLIIVFITSIMGAAVQENSLHITGVIVAIIYFIFFPRIQRRSIKKNVSKLLNEGNNKNFICERTLSIEDSNLKELTEYETSSLKVSSIENIEEDKDFYYIYIDSLRAHVVPKERIREGDLDAFISKLKTITNYP